MIDTKLLSEKFTGVVGLYSQFQGADNQPADYHREPVVYLSDAHKLLRTEILQALGPNSNDTYPPTYSQSTSYKQYDLVVQNQELFESQVNANLGQDLSDPNYWRKTTLMSAWYGRIERGGIQKLALLLGQNPPSKALLDRQPLYNREGNVRNTLTKTGRFCGLRLQVKGNDTAFYLAKVGLQLSGPVANFPIYLFRSDDVNPIEFVRLNSTTAGRTVWAEVDRCLYSNDNDYYLIGYFESDLPPGISAIANERSLSVSSCSGCDPSDYELTKGRAKFIGIESVYVEEPTDNGLMSWNEENVVVRQTWGINLVIEARCTVTKTMLDNRDLLTDALLHVIACDVLEEISTTDRVNSVVTTAKNQAYVALYGQANTKSDFGLAGKLETKIKDLKAVMAKISPNCMADEVAPKRVPGGFGNIWD